MIERVWYLDRLGLALSFCFLIGFSCSGRKRQARDPCLSSPVIPVFNRNRFGARRRSVVNLWAELVGLGMGRTSFTS